MKTVLLVGVVVAGLFFATITVVRFAVRFLRWAREHRGDAGEWLLVSFVRESLGNWVDDVADSPPWFPFEGHGHHDASGHHEGSIDAGHDCSHGGDSVCGD
jgi:hypothetical protein